MKQPFYPEDFTTPTWRKVEERLQELLDKARTDLEAPGLDEKPNGTIRLRARITLLKHLLELPTLPTRAADDTDDD